MSHKSVLQECHLDICSFSNVFAFGFVGSILFIFSRILALSVEFGPRFGLITLDIPISLIQMDSQ